MMMNQIDKIELLRIPIHKVTMKVLLADCDRAIIRKQNVVLGMVNAAKGVCARC